MVVLLKIEISLNMRMIICSIRRIYGNIKILMKCLYCMVALYYCMVALYFIANKAGKKKRRNLSGTIKEIAAKDIVAVLMNLVRTSA